MSEQDAWVDHSPDDGLPLRVIPMPRPDAPARAQSRFRTGGLADVDVEVESSDGLILLGTHDDHPGGWLQAGEGLSALWLLATTAGLSVVPLSQVIEVRETRRALARDVLRGMLHPLVLVRVGWQPIGRSELPRTPRRPVAEILHTA